MKTCRVAISVIGRPNSGKTTIMMKIIEALTASDIEVVPVWTDGPPVNQTPELNQKRLQAVAKKTKVFLTEFQAARTKPEESPDYVKVRVTYTVGIGFEVCVCLLGANLRHNFGDHETSREKALAIGERLATELGIEVDDQTVRPIEWVQPAHVP